MAPSSSGRCVSVDTISPKPLNCLKADWKSRSILNVTFASRTGRSEWIVLFWVTSATYPLPARKRLIEINSGHVVLRR